MRFDNAFLTCKKKVGIQFIVKGETITVYEDDKGVVQASPNFPQEIQEEAIKKYHNRRKFYARFDQQSD
jgi:hypothetical protein